MKQSRWTPAWSWPGTTRGWNMSSPTTLSVELASARRAFVRRVTILEPTYVLVGSRVPLSSRILRRGAAAASRQGTHLSPGPPSYWPGPGSWPCGVSGRGMSPGPESPDPSQVTSARAGGKEQQWAGPAGRCAGAGWGRGGGAWAGPGGGDVTVGGRGGARR